MQYTESFVLVVRAAHDQQFMLTAFFRGAPLATTTIPEALPLLKPEEITRAQEWLQRGVIDAAYAQDLGRRLFATLFPPPILAALDQARSAVQLTHDRAGQLRLVLYLPPALETLPWELLYSSNDGFLARSERAPISRHFDGLPPAAPPPNDGPLRILVITASPAGYPPVSQEIEADTIQQIMEQGQMDWRRVVDVARHRFRTADAAHVDLPVLTKLVTVDVLPHATRSSIQRKVNEAQGKGRGFHVVHFVGHGITNAEGTFLLIEKEAGAPEANAPDAGTLDTIAPATDADGVEEGNKENGDFIRADELAELTESASLHLVFLNACQTGTTIDIFNGAAHAFFRRGAAIVIGMQTEILDEAALRFAQEFYQAWATRAPLERALASARRLAVSSEPGAAADWAIPVVYAGPETELDLKLNLTPLRAIWPLVMTWRGITAILVTLGLIATGLNYRSIWAQAYASIPPLRCSYRYVGSYRNLDWLSNPNALNAGFNAVMAPISIEGAVDKGPTDEDAELLADQVWSQFTQSLARNERLRVSYALRSSDETCPIQEKTAEERQQSAEALANHFNANLVVYGVVKPGIDQETAFFQPEFWVNYGGFAANADINGTYSLGHPVPINLPVRQSDFQGTIHPASTRIEALSLMAVGLAALAKNDYGAAIANLNEASNLSGWQNWQGKQIVHLWLGNAYLAQAQAVYEAERTLALNEALKQYQIAAQLASKYAEPLPRAELGIVSVQYLLARAQLGTLLEEYGLYSASPDRPLPRRNETNNAPTYTLEEAEAMNRLATDIEELDQQFTEIEAWLETIRQDAERDVGEVSEAEEGSDEIAARAEFNLAQLYMSRQDLVTLYERYKTRLAKQHEGDEKVLQSLLWMPKAYTLLFDILCQYSSDPQSAACTGDSSTSVEEVCADIVENPTISGELAGYALMRVALIANTYEPNLKAANQCYEQAIQWIPDYAKADYYFDLAQWYQSHGELGTAIAYYEKSIVKGENSNRARQVEMAIDKLRQIEFIQVQRALWGH